MVLAIYIYILRVTSGRLRIQCAVGHCAFELYVHKLVGMRTLDDEWMKKIPYIFFRYNVTFLTLTKVLANK